MKLPTSLDRAQSQAVRSEARVTLVVGGPGTGKTEVIAHRAAELAGAQGKGEGILVLVSRQAHQSRLRAQIEGLVGRELPCLRVTTIARLGAEILSRHAPLRGRTERFVMHDRSDAAPVVEELLRSFGVDDTLQTEEVLARIWRAKAQNQSADALRLLASEDNDLAVARICGRYNDQLRRCDAFDLEDLAVELIAVLKDPDALSVECSRVKHLLIDDYQELTPAQEEVVQCFGQGAMLFACGNDDQLVAEPIVPGPQGVLAFSGRYPDAPLVYLDRCYRGPVTAVQAANEIIARNQTRLSKLRTPVGPEGAAIPIYASWNERGEAADVERCYRELLTKGARPAELAIVARSATQFRAIEEHFQKLVIPYRLLGGREFYRRKEAKDLLAYLKVIYNPSDLVSLRRIINVPRRGIGKLTLERVRNHAAEQSLSLFDALRAAKQVQKLPKNSKTKILKFCGLIDELNARVAELTVAQILDRIVQETAYIEDIHQQNVADRDAREAVVREIQGLAHEHSAREGAGNIGSFLSETCLRVDADRYDPEADVVHLITAPVIRDLTFPHLILVGAEEGVFPQAEENEDLEAERRLFHVVLGRATRSIAICHARNRKRERSGFRGRPSRFIDEIPAEIRDHMETFTRETELFDTEVAREDVAPQQSTEWVRFESGDRVKHPEWGAGTVVEVEGLGQDAKLQIAFEGGLVKKLLTRYANLAKMS